jgi:hypothetical protein
MVLLRPAVWTEQGRVAVCHVLTRVFICVGSNNRMDVIKLMCNYFSEIPTF